MSPDLFTVGAYNRNIDKRLARKLVWLRETKDHVIYLAPVIRLVAANRRIAFRARSAIDWGLYTEGKRSRAQRPKG